MLRSALPGVFAFVCLAVAGALRAEALHDDTADLMALAVALEHGEGVPRDPPRAALLYCEAGRAGNAEALFNLGWMYANGRGVARDDAIAAALFAQAAAAGHEQAARMRALVRSDEWKLPECLKPVTVAVESGLPGDSFEVEPGPFAEMTLDKQRIIDLVTQVAPRYAIEPRLALAVIAAESNFVPDARSNKNAQGLMQLIPDTADRFNVRNPFDVRENVRGGLTYLRWLLAYYRGDVTLAVAAYNAGEKAVDRYRGIPPYPETRGYVRRVMRLFRRERHPYDPGIVPASPIVLTPVATRTN